MKAIQWVLRHKTLALLLCVAAAGAVCLVSPAPMPAAVTLPVSRVGSVSPAPTPTPAALAVYRAQRAAAREQEQAMLAAIAGDEAADGATRELARAQLLESARCQDAELALEGLLVGMGYEGGVAVVRKGAVTVLVPRELTAQQACALLAAAMDVTGEQSDSVRVMTGNIP